VSLKMPQGSSSLFKEGYNVSQSDNALSNRTKYTARPTMLTYSLIADALWY
jgi:hypothetical protein